MLIDCLNKKIIECNKCERLVSFREKIARIKRKQYLSQNYWGKPVHGFGDRNAEILILGLAPAAHGANRTGRVFTGDKSSEFLFKSLFLANFANKVNSINLNDGLKLKNVYISLVLKCVPPNDKPTSSELSNCFPYLLTEINTLSNIKKVITLGKIAFEAYLKSLNYKISKFKFEHGKNYSVKDKIILIACYHPSPRNVNTGRLSQDMLTNLFKKIRNI
tara:strand:- start:4596 stop:5252 length:657 start_codon:yes stop_codon:yes gene_type:complete